MPGRAALASIPFLGAGLGYRHQLRSSIFEWRDSLDFLEIIADNFVGGSQVRRELSQLCEAFAIIPHGVGLSVGSVSLDTEYLREIKRVSDVTGSPYYSEHLAMTRSAGIDLGHLAPIWFTERSLDLVSQNVRRVQEELEKPLVLENITYPFEIPHGTMAQTEFFGRLVEATGCGILLDVTNVHINAVNHAFSPRDFLRAMPVESIVQVHLAGGSRRDGVLIDSHSEPVEAASWSLLEELAALMPIKAAILEHDANFPDDFSLLMRQVARARDILFDGARPSSGPGAAAV